MRLLFDCNRSQEDIQIKAAKDANATPRGKDICNDTNVKKKVVMGRPSLAAESTALLIVDVQPEFWTHCPSIEKDFPDFEQNLERTVQLARERKAKITWARADFRRHQSPWLKQFGRLVEETVDATDTLPCEPESATWETFAIPQGGETILAKISWSSTFNTPLLHFLRLHGIDTVLVCGLNTSTSVQKSAFGIFEAGFRTLVVKDACCDRVKEPHEAALALYGDYMYEIITSSELADPDKGLRRAIKPVWITKDHVKETSPSNSYESTMTSENYIAAYKRRRGSSGPKTNFLWSPQA
ncbi:hypothetical protein CTEN210_02687 [Chaetoceros tenuissimus]|uniref:Isochorismatase-like domain-containing protein n=1 Tax=Chaetoceros tenuissimus TaxID=426638 RepID=A0AAD3CIE8_9STRA|nr:hypothetical protein CTEN210_02687 [Chaetoceros tenuissimus]